MVLDYCPSAAPTQFHNHRAFHDAPIILNFSPADVLRNQETISCSYNAGTTQPETAASTRRRSRAQTDAKELCSNHDRPHMMDVDASPVQGPVAPPQREGAPLDYMCFGRCDQICQHCHALFWLEEKKAGMPASAAPQYQKCCAGDETPRFLQMLFAVIGANQYELPTADTIGAIVYEGGPESMTHYDVVIERHSREPENVNKLHPTYMALQFPLLFNYGEEGYHLNLTLRNLGGSGTQEEKKMTMKHRTRKASRVKTKATPVPDMAANPSTSRPRGGDISEVFVEHDEFIDELLRKMNDVDSDGNLQDPFFGVQATQDRYPTYDENTHWRMQAPKQYISEDSTGVGSSVRGTSDDVRGSSGGDTGDLVFQIRGMQTPQQQSAFRKVGVVVVEVEVVAVLVVKLGDLMSQVCKLHNSKVLLERLVVFNLQQEVHQGVQDSNSKQTGGLHIGLVRKGLVKQVFREVVKLVVGEVVMEVVKLVVKQLRSYAFPVTQVNQVKLLHDGNWDQHGKTTFQSAMVVLVHPQQRRLLRRKQIQNRGLLNYLMKK
ncbi:hypothetical protein CTI12_AA156410 [Artemisia annua]|uniref:Helitron helicase-like domain-containing protein n=1 Tax=Artemisia annua TaxID=35608 RepID=A0A2U1PFQ5_ARTAN|nr:hypothetical protein CTI12_AA156410 [Artemisia annua]